ncbi:MAG: PLAT/LH2 domain-containing protein [Ferruginibacter sp.]
MISVSKKNDEQLQYIFLLRHGSAESRKITTTILRDSNVSITAQHGDEAVEIKCTPSKAEVLFTTGLFSAYSSKKITLEKGQQVSALQEQIISIWNTRFSKEYRKIKKDKTNYAKSWGDKELKEPAPYTRYDPERFKQLLKEAAAKQQLVHNPDQKLSGKDKELLKDKLRKNGKDETEQFYLGRLFPYLGPEYQVLLFLIDATLLAEIIAVLLLETPCWKMTGEISVGLVFVESTRAGGPKFGTTERSQICAEIIDGFNYLSSQHPSGNLSWVYDLQFIGIDVPDGPDVSDAGNIAGGEAHWRDPAMAKVTYHGNTYTGDWNGVVKYREDMRRRNFSVHAIAVFVTPYGNNWHAYAGGARLTLAKHNNWGGWGQSVIDIITSHEVSHLFGAADEYSGSGTPCNSCEGQHGCDKIPNGNCGSCASPKQDCIMAENQHRICNYTKGQIGWADLFIELWTADELWAGTDDDVSIDIGDRTFNIDTPDVDDFERGSRIGYALWAGGIRRDEIKRILIRKSPDGFAGGWKLKRVRVFHQGDIICDQSPNRWLEDDRRWWLGCVMTNALVNTLRVKITTADVSWAGTDDDIRFTIGGRSWNLDNPSKDDFERGNTDTFDLDPGTSFYVSDIHAVQVHKSPDGFSGGWKLKGVEIIVNGNTIYNNQSINRWLEDNNRDWSASI